MKQQKWIRITNCENIPLREGRSLKIGECEIGVFNLGDRFLAVENRCPHQGGPLADGIISGTAVVCPLHAWKIDLESGAVLKPSDTTNCLHAFETRIEDGIVLLDISGLETTRSEEEISCSLTPQDLETQKTAT